MKPKSKILVTSLSLLATSVYAQPSIPAGVSPPVNRPEVSREVSPSTPQPAMQTPRAQPAAGSAGGAGGNGGNGGLFFGNGGAGGEGVAKPSSVAPSSSEINGRMPPLPPLPPTSTPAVKPVNPRTGEVASQIKASGEVKGGIKAVAEGASGSQANARPPLPDSQAGNSGVSLNDKKDIQSVGATQSKSQGMLSRPAYIVPMTPGKVVFSLSGADSLFHGPGVLHSSNEVGASAPSQEKIQQREETVARLQEERAVAQEKRAPIEQKRAPIEQKRDEFKEETASERNEMKKMAETNKQVYGTYIDYNNINPDLKATWAVCIHPKGYIDLSSYYYEIYNELMESK